MLWRSVLIKMDTLIRYCRLLLLFLLLKDCADTVKSEILRLSCTSDAIFDSIKENRALNATFRTVYGIDAQTCKAHCVIDTKCKSVNVNEEKNICELNDKSDANRNDVVTVLNRTGWTYYSTKYNQLLVGRNCRKYKPCQRDEKCYDSCKCPGYRCVRLHSCIDWYKEGVRTNGYYRIVGHKLKLYPVYCDFTSERSFVWTLVTSYALKEKGYFSKPFTESRIRSSNNPNWISYRIGKTRMERIKTLSTHWRVTCDFPRRENIFTDYYRVSIQHLNPMEYNGEGKCKHVDYINVRGNSMANVTVQFWQATDTILHTDSSIKLCSFDARNGSVPNEDNFGYYHTVNANFACTRTLNSTTQYWFGASV